MEKPDLWLVRTAQNQIAGPYTKDQVRELVRKRELHLQDEVCVANHFWFHLHEHDEVVRNLGQDVLTWLADEKEEITETQTEPGSSRSDREAKTKRIVAQVEAAQSVTASGASVMVSVAGFSVQPVTQSSGQASSSPSGPRTNPSLPDTLVSHPNVVGHNVPRLERPSVWRGVAWVLVGVAALVVWAVFHLTRH